MDEQIRLFVQVYFEGKTLQRLFDYRGKDGMKNRGGKKTVIRVTL